MRMIFAALAVYAASLSIAWTQPVSAGTYFVSAVPSSGNNHCGWLNAPFVLGALTYPGVGMKGTELDTAPNDAQYLTQSVILRGFPPVPSGGLNGWTAAAPAVAEAFSYAPNGLKRTNEGKQAISFALSKIGAHAANGTMTISSTDCSASFVINIFRTGAVH